VIRELDVVRLTETVDGLPAGEIGTVVMVHDEGAAFEVEFVGRPGDTVAMRADQLEPIT
jgi:hypothetical protein